MYVNRDAPIYGVRIDVIVGQDSDWLQIKGVALMWMNAGIMMTFVLDIVLMNPGHIDALVLQDIFCLLMKGVVKMSMNAGKGQLMR